MNWFADEDNWVSFCVGSTKGGDIDIAKSPSWMDFWIFSELPLIPPLIFRKYVAHFLISTMIIIASKNNF